MRIITVNVPQSYLKAIDKLTGRSGLYPSRSELIRVAVKEFLVNELDTAKDFKQSLQRKNEKIIPPLDPANFVQVGDTIYKLVH